MKYIQSGYMEKTDENLQMVAPRCRRNKIIATMRVQIKVEAGRLHLRSATASGSRSFCGCVRNSRMSWDILPRGAPQGAEGEEFLSAGSSRDSGGGLHDPRICKGGYPPSRCNVGRPERGLCLSGTDYGFTYLINGLNYLIYREML